MLHTHHLLLVERIKRDSHDERENDDRQTVRIGYTVQELKKRKKELARSVPNTQDLHLSFRSPLPQLQELSEPFPRSYLAVLRHRVEAALVPRAAFKQPRCGEIRPYDRAVYFQSFGGVLRAARIKTAFAASEQRRDGRLIKADGEQQNQSERTTYQPRFESTPQSAPGQSFVRSPRRFMHAARS